MQQKSTFRRVSNVLLSVALIAVAVVVATHYRQIYDWYRLRDYQPPAEVVQLADQTTMTPDTRRLFYVNRPLVDDKANFNKHCPSGGNEQTIVLGCYIGGENGIYLYNVSDPELKGVVQVTAAHEVLHAIYERLGRSEKNKVNAMLEDYYNNDLHDERLIKVFESYKKSEPNELVNEMHSIFGTEIGSLPAGLEDYYKQYFTDRSKIVAYADAYQGAFTRRREQVKAYDTQLTALKSQIEANEKQLEQQTATLTQQKAELDSQLAQKNYTAYNALVNEYNATVRSYNNLVNSTQALINQYNDIVKTRNELALEEQDLFKAIDSRLQTQSTQ